MSNTSFQFVPDSSQQAVIDAQGGYHLVLAPPGCGKTGILAERISRAHAMGVPNDDMLCLTFTNRASREMTERIALKMQGQAPEGLMVGNVHRFCSKFLFEKGHIEADSSIIDDDEAISILSDFMAEDDEAVKNDFNRLHGYQQIIHFSHLIMQIACRHGVGMLMHPDSFTKEDREAFSELCKLRGLHFGLDALLKVYRHIPDYIDDATDLGLKGVTGRHLHSLLWKIFYAAKYEGYKRENDMLDFEDLLLRTYEVYKKDATCKRYHWIQVDEVQDLNGMQLAIIDQLTAKDHFTVMYLGDEQQAIFSFMGAKLDTLTELKIRCKGHLHHLMQNHRSPSYLLDVFNTYAKETLHIDKELLPVTDREEKAPAGSLQILYSDTLESELMDVCDRVEALQAQSKTDTTAVIVSANSDADKLSEVMTSRGLPHFKVSGQDLFASPAMKLLLAHFNVEGREDNFICWSRIFTGLRIFKTQALSRRFVHKLKQLSLSPTDFLYYDKSSYLNEFVKHYEQDELVIFDTETTGLDTKTNDIIEISAMKIRHGKVVGTSLDLYIATRQPIPAMLGDKENPMRAIYEQKQAAGELLQPAQALAMFLEYVGDDPVMGHNVAFDYHILQSNMQRYLPEKARGGGRHVIIDTLKLIRLLQPNLTSYKLESLLDYYHLKGVNSHQAIDDVAATVSLVNFCYAKALPKLSAQMAFITHDKVTPYIYKFRTYYRELFMHTHRRLYARPAEGSFALSDEMQWVYAELLKDKWIGEIDKWSYVMSYMRNDMLAADESSDLLVEQLANHIMELNTAKEADFCNSRGMKDRVYVTTVHKAKGLEFDNVIVFDAVDGRYPNFFNKSEKRDAEDARKFYVALSRAKKRLYVAYSMKTMDGYGRIHSRQLTRFMDPVQKFFS